MDSGQSSAPGRVCLAGEDLDWITGPSILCAVDLRIVVTIKILDPGSTDVQIQSGAPFRLGRSVNLARLDQYDGHPLDYVQAAVKVFFDFTGEKRPVAVQVESRLPARAGMSSSAALLVSTLNALSRAFAAGLSHQNVCELAFQAEDEELRTGAGQMDFYACALGGTRYLNCATNPPATIEQVHSLEKICIVVIDTLQYRSTKVKISEKQKRWCDREFNFVSYVSQASELVEELRRLLQLPGRNMVEIGQLVTECHYMLRDLQGVSTPMLDLCVQRSLENGAYGAKLTGSGGGGCMFALFDDDRAPTVLEAFSELPVNIQVTRSSSVGLSLEPLLSFGG